MSTTRLFLTIFAAILAAALVVFLFIEWQGRRAAQAMEQELRQLQREEHVARGRAAVQVQRAAAQGRRDVELHLLRTQGPRLPEASSGMRPGTVACLEGFQVRRESNGWSDVLSRRGGRSRCRLLR